MNKFKKRIVLLMAAIIAALSLTACGKFTCDVCNEEKSGKKYEGTVLGEKVTMCEDCHKEIESIKNLFK